MIKMNNSVMKCCICNNEKIGEFITINDKKYHLCCIEQLQNNWNELKKLIDERIGDCRYFLANADVNYEKENMKKFMWLKEELQFLKSKAQELEQGKDEN